MKTEEEIEKKLRNFLLNRVLPLMTDELEEAYPLNADLIGNKHGSIFNETNYGAFLDQWFSSAWRKPGKCKCINKINSDKGLTLLQLLIFIEKHNINFCDNSGHYCEGGSYFYIGAEASINISFSTHSMLLGSELRTAVKSGFDYLKGKYCSKNYPPSDSDFNYEYWKIQAQLFFKGLPPLSNRGCSDKKPGITWNKECKICVYFNNKEYGVCDFDYIEKYRDNYHRSTKIGFVLLLPDNGKTYACKHFDKYV